MIVSKVPSPSLSRRCKNRQSAVNSKKIHIAIREGEVRKSWPRIVFALLDYGVRRCRQLERRFCRFLSLSFPLRVFSFFPLSVSLSEKWYSNDRARVLPARFSSSLTFAYLPSSYPDLKAALQRFVAFAWAPRWMCIALRCLGNGRHLAKVTSLVLHLCTQTSRLQHAITAGARVAGYKRARGMGIYFQCVTYARN